MTDCSILCVVIECCLLHLKCWYRQIVVLGTLTQDITDNTILSDWVEILSNSIFFFFHSAISLTGKNSFPHKVRDRVKVGTIKVTQYIPGPCCVLKGKGGIAAQIVLGYTVSLWSSFFLPAGRTGALRVGFTEGSSALHLTDLGSICCLVYLLKEFSKSLNYFLSCRGLNRNTYFWEK